jgi:hypothetical protein
LVEADVKLEGNNVIIEGDNLKFSGKADVSEISGKRLDVSEISGKRLDVSEISGKRLDVSEISGKLVDYLGHSLYFYRKSSDYPMSALVCEGVPFSVHSGSNKYEDGHGIALEHDIRNNKLLIGSDGYKGGVSIYGGLSGVDIHGNLKLSYGEFDIVGPVTEKTIGEGPTSVTTEFRNAALFKSDTIIFKNQSRPKGFPIKWVDEIVIDLGAALKQDNVKNTLMINSGGSYKGGIQISGNLQFDKNAGVGEFDVIGPVAEKKLGTGSASYTIQLRDVASFKGNTIIFKNQSRKPLDAKWKDEIIIDLVEKIKDLTTKIDKLDGRMKKHGI